MPNVARTVLSAMLLLAVPVPRALNSVLKRFALPVLARFAPSLVKHVVPVIRASNTASTPTMVLVSFGSPLSLALQAPFAKPLVPALELLASSPSLFLARPALNVALLPAMVSKLATTMFGLKPPRALAVKLALPLVPVPFALFKLAPLATLVLPSVLVLIVINNVFNRRLDRGLLAIPATALPALLAMFTSTITPFVPKLIKRRLHLRKSLR